MQAAANMVTHVRAMARQSCDLRVQQFVSDNLNATFQSCWCFSLSGTGFEVGIWPYECCVYLIPIHYNDVIMGAIACQITSLTIIFSTVYSDADQRKHQSSASLAYVGPGTGDRWIPRTNGQQCNVSISWRHHDLWNWRLFGVLGQWCLPHNSSEKYLI